MTPFELFQWAIGVSLSIVVVAFALCVAIVLVRGALRAKA